MSKDLPACPRCGSTTAVRTTTWLAAPYFTCDDCARAGLGAESYFDAPRCDVCKGTGIVSHGYVADVGDCMSRCRCGA